MELMKTFVFMLTLKSGEARSEKELFCRERPPPLCERHLVPWGNATAPPCLHQEAFTSRGSSMEIQQQLLEGTAFQPWHYVLVYEFFREAQDGLPLNVSHPHGCHRIFSSQHEMKGVVRSPQNVFLFGRGGAQNLR